ncbi:MAG: STAS domain-containing protein [Betaproteobacteria bacterium]|nr:STAS domain-containing protein [Betaproteobacteria bacterium]
MNHYSPEEIKFANAEPAIRAGSEEIAKHGELIMDIGALGDGNTAAVCALLEWKRRAAENKCRLDFENIPPRLKELISVYQLESLLLNSKTAKETPPPSE